jgi:hypothetical protein
MGLIQIGGRRSVEHEQERRSLLFYERFIRSSGVLYAMVGLAFVLSVVGATIDGGRRVDPLSALTLTAIGAALGAAGVEMFRLDARVRPFALVLGALGLCALGSFFFMEAVPHPVLAMSGGGAIFHAAMLLVLLAPKGRRVLSPAYQDVLQATRELKPGPSLVVWAIVASTVAAAVAV